MARIDVQVYLTSYLWTQQNGNKLNIKVDNTINESNTNFAVSQRAIVFESSGYGEELLQSTLLSVRQNVNEVYTVPSNFPGQYNLYPLIVSMYATLVSEQEESATIQQTLILAQSDTSFSFEICMDYTEGGIEYLVHENAEVQIDTSSKFLTTDSQTKEKIVTTAIRAVDPDGHIDLYKFFNQLLGNAGPRIYNSIENGEINMDNYQDVAAKELSNPDLNDFNESQKAILYEFNTSLFKQRTGKLPPEILAQIRDGTINRYNYAQILDIMTEQFFPEFQKYAVSKASEMIYAPITPLNFHNHPLQQRFILDMKDEWERYIYSKYGTNIETFIRADNSNDIVDDSLAKAIKQVFSLHGDEPSTWLSYFGTGEFIPSLLIPNTYKEYLFQQKLPDIYKDRSYYAKNLAMDAFNLYLLQQSGGLGLSYIMLKEAFFAPLVGLALSPNPINKAIYDNLVPNFAKQQVLQALARAAGDPGNNALAMMNGQHQLNAHPAITKLLEDIFANKGKSALITALAGVAYVAYSQFTNQHRGLKQVGLISQHDYLMSQENKLMYNLLQQQNMRNPGNPELQFLTYQLYPARKTGVNMGIGAHALNSLNSIKNNTSVLETIANIAERIAHVPIHKSDVAKILDQIPLEALTQNINLAGQGNFAQSSENIQFNKMYNESLLGNLAPSFGQTTSSLLEQFLEYISLDQKSNLVLNRHMNEMVNESKVANMKAQIGHQKSKEVGKLALGRIKPIEHQRYTSGYIMNSSPSVRERIKEHDSQQQVKQQHNIMDIIKSSMERQLSHGQRLRPSRYSTKKLSILGKRMLRDFEDEDYLIY